MTALRIDAKRSARVTWRSASKALPRLYRPGEYEAEERRKFLYRFDHHERLHHAERCVKGDQFRAHGYYDDNHPDHY